jgi:hypothetical protein
MARRCLCRGGICTLIKVTVSRGRGPFTYLPESSARIIRSMRRCHARFLVDAFRTLVHGVVLGRLRDHRPLDLAADGRAGSSVRQWDSWRIAGDVDLGAARRGRAAFSDRRRAGGAIGAAGGVAVPLLHRWFRGHDRAPVPPARAWLQTAASTVVGVGAGLRDLEIRSRIERAQGALQIEWPRFS